MSIRRAQDERIEGTPDGLNAVSEIMDVPDAPTIGAATNVGTSRAYNDGSATVAFTAPTTGGTPTTYTATSTPGSLTGTAASSPVTVTGLQSATSYTFAVKGTNVNAAASPDSAASSSITATTVPQAPTIGTATLSTTTASVPFTAGATGGATVTTFTATSSPGSLTGTSASSPISVTGLSYGTAYTFTVTATNANGTSAASSASNSLTPVEPKSGYALGGSGPGGVIYTTDKLNFANDTNSTISGNEISAGGNMGFADSGTAGYSTGGGFPGGRVQSTGRRVFATDTFTSGVSSMSTGTSGGGATANRGQYGYVGGGDTYEGAYLSRVEKMAFSNNTWSSSGSLPTARAQLFGGSYNTGTAGYFKGGVQGPAQSYASLSDITKITFSTHGVSTLGSTLSNVIYGSTSMSNSGTAGYTHVPVVGGYLSTRVDKMAFSTETNSSIGNIWPNTVRYGAQMSNKGIAGYTGGGSGSNYLSAIYKIAFSNDSTSTVSGGLAGGVRSRLGGYANEGSSL